MSSQRKIIVGSSFPSRRFSDSDAVDVCVTVAGTSGIATVRPRELDGLAEPAAGGDWLSFELRRLGAPAVDGILDAIQQTWAEAGSGVSSSRPVR